MSRISDIVRRNGNITVGKTENRNNRVSFIDREWDVKPNNQIHPDAHTDRKIVAGTTASSRMPETSSFRDEDYTSTTANLRDWQKKLEQERNELSALIMPSAKESSRLKDVERQLSSVNDAIKNVSGKEAAQTASTVRQLEEERKRREEEYKAAVAAASAGSGNDPTKWEAAREAEDRYNETKQKLKDLDKSRFDYDVEVAKKKQQAYTDAEAKVVEKYGTVDNLVANLVAQAGRVTRLQEELKELEARAKTTQSEVVTKEIQRVWAEYEQALDKHAEMYEEYVTVQSAWQAYDDYATAAKTQAKPGEVLGLVVDAGSKQFAQSILATLSVPERVLSEKLFPGMETPFKDLSDIETARAEEASERLAAAVYNQNGWKKFVAEVGKGAVAAIPQAVLAYLTAGASLGTTAAGAAAGTTLLTGASANTTAGLLLETAKKAMKNPSYLTSFAQTFGNDFITAKDEGASDLEAVAAAFISSAVNAGIEVGGGLEKNVAGEVLIRRILRSGREEGWEEVLQALVTGITQKAVYGDDKPWLSMTDKNAVVNPAVLAENYVMGSAVGSILSGGTGLVQAGVQGSAGVDMQAPPVAPKNIVRPVDVSPAATATVQEADVARQMTQTANPTADVQDAATTAYLELDMDGKGTHMSLKKAQAKAKVVNDLIAGKNVDVDQIKTLSLNSPAFRNVFTQLTGVEFGSTITPEVLYATARTAHEVAIRAEEADRRAAEFQANVDRTTATENREDSTSTTASSSVSVNQIPTEEEFAQQYRAVHPEAADPEVHEQYEAFVADAEVFLSTVTTPSGTTITKDQYQSYMERMDAQNGAKTDPDAVERQFNWLRANASDERVARVIEAIANDMKEESANAGEGVSSGDGLRRSGQSEGERSGAVSEGRRGAETEDRERGSSGDTARTDSRGTGGDQEVPGENGSVSRESEVKALHDRKPKTRTFKVDGESIAVLRMADLDEGSKRVRAKFAKIGSRIYYTLGNLPVVVNGKRVKNKRAAGIHFRGVTYAQMDNLVSTGEQIGDHEFIHELLMKFPQLRENMRAAFKALDGDTRARLYKGYEQLYSKTLKGKSPDVAVQAIMDDIFCDAYAGINRSGLGAPVLRSQITGIVDPFVEGYVAAQQDVQRQYKGSISDSDTEDRDFSLDEMGNYDYSYEEDSFGNPIFKLIDSDTGELYTGEDHFRSVAEQSAEDMGYLPFDVVVNKLSDGALEAYVLDNGMKVRLNYADPYQDVDYSNLDEDDIPAEAYLDDGPVGFDDMPAEEDTPMNPHAVVDSELQKERDGFTPTDTKAFKDWFHDDSGWLSLADGRPKVLARGSTNVGQTVGRAYSLAKSGGTFATDEKSIAYEYGSGITSDRVSIADIVGLNDRRYGDDLIETGYKSSWEEMFNYIRRHFRTADAKVSGLNILAERNGLPTSLDSADTFILSTDILPPEDRVGYDSEEGRITDRASLKVTGENRELAEYPATEEGLDQLNRDLGGYLGDLGLGVKGFYLMYGSASKTLVVDCHGYGYGDIPNEFLPEFAWSKTRPEWDTASHLNGVARRAFQNGYDCVVAVNVDDAGGEHQTQYIFKNPEQVKSVYNKGTWDTESADRNFALDEADSFLADHGLRSDYANWSELYRELSFSSGVRHNLAFDLEFPAMLGDTNAVGAVGFDGEWLETLGEYESTPEGLAQFNADIRELAERAEEISEHDAEFMGATDKENLGSFQDENIEMTSSILSNAFSLLNDAKNFRKETATKIADSLQDNREGFTPTDTEEFRDWQSAPEGTGLTQPDGQPTVFLRGTPTAGRTKARAYTASQSPGTWFTTLHKVAEIYARGITSKKDFTPMDSLGVNKARGETVPELKHRVHETWRELADFIHRTYRNEENNGMRLVALRNGKPTSMDSADEFVLQTNILPSDLWYGLDETGHLRYDEADSIYDTEVITNTWSSLAKYPATEQGLEDLNRSIGDWVSKVEAGIRAYSKYYLSMENPLVIDCEKHSCHQIPNELLPEWAWGEEGFRKENSLVYVAFENGYDGVVLKRILDEGGVQDQYCVKYPWQMKSVYNRGTWSRADDDVRYALDEEDQRLFSDLLSQIEQDYSSGAAQKLVEAFNARQTSMLAAKRMAAENPSIGAADLGFDPYSNLQNRYGTIEPGEKPARVEDVPKQTADNNKVSLTPRTVMEAKATPDSRIPTIQDAVVDHAFSYSVGHNKVQENRAVAQIRRDGWEATLSKWTQDVRDGKVDAQLVALGAVMLNNAGNSDMSGARYTRLLVDYTNLLRSSGQATQAARIMKNLTPNARLYGIQGYINQMNGRIRQDDPAVNIPVEKWMEVTGNLLADRLRTAVGGSRRTARTTAQTILSDLNAFAREAFPAKEKTPGRTEMERLQDLFDNYDNYREAWESAKDTIRERYKDQPEALAAFEGFLETDLAETFLGRYFKHPGLRISGDLAEELLRAKTDEEIDAAIDRITSDIARQIPATRMEKFTALRYLNMLGNFKTQERNILGNGFNLALTMTKNQVAALLELGALAAGIEVERTKSFTRDHDTYQAALSDFETMKDVVLSGGKYQDGNRFDKQIEDKRTIFKNKFLEGYRKATNWAMTQGDLFFSRIAYADALAGYLSAHGVTFETAGETLLEQARLYAVQQAAEATFRDSNMISDAVAAMRFRNPDTFAKKAFNTIADGLIPFRKTPANILVRSVEYSPVGALVTAAEAIYGKKTGTLDASKVIDSLAKNITGTGLMILGCVLANAGLLKGASSDDDKEKQFEELTGHQAYSIELPNGMSLTLDWLAPSSIPIFLGVQMAETAAEEGLSLGTTLQAIGAITDPMLQMSMLQGLDDALSNASTYGDDSALVRFTGNALWSFATQGLTNTMLGQLERSMKNERSTTYQDKNKELPGGIQYLLGKTLEKVPVPGVDYGQIPYIDAWGRVEQNAKTDFGNVFTQFFSPSYLSYVNESDMEEELQRLYDATGESSVLISRPKSYFNVDKERKDLTAEEYVEYATTRGQTAYSVATDLTESAIYGTLSDKEKVVAVEKAYDFASQLAKASVTGYDPSKWTGEAPEGAVVPDKWVMNAAQDAAEYGISVGDYVATYAKVKDATSYTDKNGETVDNSKSLKIAAAIYDLGLETAQAKKLMEDFGVNKTVRGYSEAMTRRKLESMQKKYE